MRTLTYKDINPALKIATWNINGWTDLNANLRINVILSLNLDIICLTETHLRPNSDIHVDGYTWYGHNRSEIHVRAIRASGGLGWLVRNALFHEYDITITDKSYEGILCLNVKHRFTGFSANLIGCYLPPEFSHWGRDSDNFFSHLITLLYMSTNEDLITICGDFNARISDKCDYIPEVDSIQSRTAIDHSYNKHGEALLEFLKDTKCCTVNGRIDINNDNFTCISTKGKSVVDYLISPHECLKYYKSVEVVTCTDVIDTFSLQGLLNDRCKMPDHSIVLCEIMLTCMATLQGNIVTIQNDENIPKPISYRFEKCT